MEYHLATSTDSNASIETRLREVRQILKDEGPAEAERATIEILKDEPKSGSAFMGLARILSMQDRYDDAVRAAEKAKTLSPLEADPLVMIGFIRVRQKDNDAAASAFSEAISLDPGSERALMGAAVLKTKDEAYDDAEELCQRVLEVNPELDQARELMARINAQKGNKAAAIEQLKEIAGRKPEDGRNTKALMVLMMQEERKEEMVEFFKDDVASDPENMARVLRFARVAAGAGTPEIAVDAIHNIANSENGRPSDEIRIIDGLIIVGELDEAEQKIADLAQTRVPPPLLHQLRGDLAFKGGKLDDAIGHYQEACSSVRAAGLDAAEEKEAADDTARAKLWRKHSGMQIATAIRDLRNKRG